MSRSVLLTLHSCRLALKALARRAEHVEGGGEI